MGILESDIHVIKEYNNGGGYEWSTVQLGIGFGKTWIRYGSGCSCDSIDGISWEPLVSANQIQSDMLGLLDTKDRIMAIPALMDWLPGSATRTIKSYANKDGTSRELLGAMLEHEGADQETKVLLVLRLSNTGPS